MSSSDFCNSIQCVSFQEVKKSLTCGICNSLIASSLVLSCGHIFCGHCLFEYLNGKPQCPTCQVNLRAIPVRCISLDSVVSAYEKFLPKAEADAFQARLEEGKSAANKLNKMLWWLQPAQIPATDTGAPGPTTGMQMPVAVNMHQQRRPNVPRHPNMQPSASFGGAMPYNQMQPPPQQRRLASISMPGGYSGMGAPVNPTPAMAAHGNNMDAFATLGISNAAQLQPYALLDLAAGFSMPHVNQPVNNSMSHAQLLQLLNTWNFGGMQ